MNAIVKKVLKPILKDKKIYIDPKFKKVKIDVGLSISAPNSELWLQNENDLMVIGFEPSSICFDSFTTYNYSTRTQYPQYVCISPEKINESFFPIQCALASGEPRYQKFYNTADNKEDKNLLGCSSLYEPSYFPILNTEEVAVISLSHMFDLFPWDIISYIDQLKLDTQGSDFDILIGTKEYLNKIVYLTLENSTHGQYKKEEDYHKFDSYLEKFNFTKISEDGINSTYLNNNHIDKIKKINFFVENK